MRAATVLSSTVDGVVEVDRGWRFTYLNDRARDMIGMGQELLGRTVWEAFPELAASELRARVQHAMDAAEPIEVEFRGPRTGRWFWARGFPSSGGLAVYLLDISGRKRAEEELRGSNERLSLALESARAGTFEWDMRTGSGSWSEESYRIFQLDPGRDPATTETWLRVVHPEDAEAVSRAYRTRMLQERVPDYRLEYRIRHPDGSLRWVQSIGRIVYGADGTPLRSSGLNIDITERKAMEEALREAKAKADEANLSKSKFLAAASHDLRQPLQSALLFAGVVQAHVRDEEARGPLASLERALDTLKNLLDSLLDVSRLDAGVIVPQPVDLAVAPLLDEIADAYGPIASAKGLDFHLDRPAPELAVHSDPLLLGRMLRNLVENALRYTDRGGIRVTCAAAGAGLRIGVHDSGIGIPPEHLNRIFEEFHQVGNPERDRKEGLGLGLAIVRRLSGLLGHPVEVRSEPGQGSSFSILVPRAAAPVPPDTAAGGEPETEPAFGVEGGGQGRLALLIDDDVIVLTGLRRLFQEWGFDTAVAGSAEQALECLRTLARVPDIIVSDYRLRENEVGTAAIARVRERVGRPVPGIILTGEIGPECRDEAAAFGIAVIHKPVTPRQLQGAVRDTLGRAG
nr:ATP-binding protein [Azospirillum sp. SYSU D00513]